MLGNLLLISLSMIIGSTASSGCWMLLCVDISEGWDGCRPAFSLGTSMFGNRTQYVRGGCRSLLGFWCRSLLGCWCRSLPACWCRSVSSCWCWSISFVLTQNGIGEYGCRLVKFECRSIRTVSHNPTDSASGVSRCSVGGVDRHQCELPMDMELSTWKSPSWSFSSFITCQKSTSMMALTWCLCVSSPFRLISASCFLKTSPVWTTWVSNFFTCVLRASNLLFILM